MLDRSVLCREWCGGCPGSARYSAWPRATRDRQQNRTFLADLAGAASPVPREIRRSGRVIEFLPARREGECNSKKGGVPTMNDRERRDFEAGLSAEVDAWLRGEN